MAALNPHLTLQQKLNQLEGEIERISSKLLDSNATTDEVFALCAAQIMLKDLYRLKAQGYLHLLIWRIQKVVSRVISLLLQ